MKVWKVTQTLNGKELTPLLCDSLFQVNDQIRFMLREYAADPSQTLSFGISCLEMSREEFEAVPEYEGE